MQTTLRATSVAIGRIYALSTGDAAQWANLQRLFSHCIKCHLPVIVLQFYEFDAVLLAYLNDVI